MGEEGQKKEGLNGEVEEETNGKTKEGKGAACSSKLRACRRTGGGEGSSAGTFLIKHLHFIIVVINITVLIFLLLLLLLIIVHCFSLTAGDCGESGSSNGEEKAGKAEGDDGPSCSSLSPKAAGDSKSMFFDDSEESEEGEEEEGSDEEVRAEDQNRFGCDISLTVKSTVIIVLFNYFY